jgi:SAM-dependent methyltransferase
MYNESIQYYDKIYSQIKNYKQEVEYLIETIGQYGDFSNKELLDVACGTGEHLKYFKSHFRAEGIDISAESVRLAKEKNPELTIHLGDMRSFLIGKRFDIITCLFSSIGYMISIQDLISAIGNMKRHLKHRGLMLIEPWITPDNWKVGHISLAVVDEEGLKIVRMSTSRKLENLSAFDLHYLVGTPENTTYFTETHQMGLFTNEEMKNSFTANQLRVEYDPKGPFGRGLYIAIYQE